MKVYGLVFTAEMIDGRFPFTCMCDYVYRDKSKAIDDIESFKKHVLSTIGPGKKLIDTKSIKITVVLQYLM